MEITYVSRKLDPTDINGYIDFKVIKKDGAAKRYRYYLSGNDFTSNGMVLNQRALQETLEYMGSLEDVDKIIIEKLQLVNEK